jgi:hypothetical protein
MASAVVSPAQAPLSIVARDWIRRVSDIVSDPLTPPCASTHESEKFIKDPLNFLTSMRRLHSSRDAVMFCNCDKGFKIMVRCDIEAIDESSETLHFDIAIVHDSDEDLDGSFAELLGLEHDGYFEDDAMFVLNTFSIPADASPSSEAVLEAMRLVNHAHASRVCACGKYLIKDASPSCIMCVMTGTREDLERHFCSICHDDQCLRKHTVLQPCCRQRLCTPCIRKWKKQSENSRCPLCRQ